jgi:hypothetical protein
LQALQLMNDVQHFEAARNFGQRMMLEGGSTPEVWIVWAWRAVTSRKPSPGELAIALETWRTHLARYQADPVAAREAIHYGESKPNPTLDPAQLAACTLTANLLFNLDETLTKN